MKPRNDIFSYADIHSHVGGHGRVQSVDVTTDPIPADPGQAFTLGVHPWNAGRPVDWEAFERLLDDPRVVGIGEAGIDRLKGPDEQRQLEVFEKQIALSEKHALPLVIHSVRANHMILQLHKRLKPTQPWIIHGFRGRPDEARQLTGAGLHLSLGRHGHPGVAAMAPSPMIHFESDEENTQ